MYIHAQQSLIKKLIELMKVQLKISRSNIPNAEINIIQLHG